MSERPPFFSMGLSARRIGIALLVAVILASGALIAAYVVRDPERTTLDDTVRATTFGKYARLADGLTHFEATGEIARPTVVLVHGFSVPYYVWDSTVTPLRAAGYRVIRYDLYGRGYSDRPDVPYDSALFIRQLDGLLDALDVHTPVHLVGVSMGGWVTASYVAAHPERVRSLTLVDPVARNGSVPAAMRLPMLGPIFWQTLVVPTMAAGQLSDFAHPERFPDWDDAYVPQTRLKGFGRALLSTREQMEHVDYDSLYTRVARTHVPVLLVWGVQDQTVPIGLSVRVRRAIPAAHWLPVEGVGHLPIIEAAPTVNAALLRFFADSAPRLTPADTTHGGR